MKTILLAAASIALAAGAEIPKGAHVLLKMMNSINTRTAADGDQVYLQTATPIVGDGGIVIPVGTYVQGTVAHTKRSGMVAGRAELGIRLETMTLASGKVLKIAPRLSSVDSEGTGQKVDSKENQVKQGNDYETDARRIAILAGTGAGIGGITDRAWEGAGIGAGIGAAVGVATTMLTRGKEVILRQGSTLDIVFDRAISLEWAPMSEHGRIIGIGGVFFKSADAAKLRAWYAANLGIESGDYGTSFPWRPMDNDEKHVTAWSIFPQNSKYFDPSPAPLMINYIVDDLDAFLDKAAAKGVRIDPKRENADYGRFAWVYDADGNKIELWQPTAPAPTQP